ncbi:hypothetical protein C4552_00530 [Candidatus Parcubacteria bacterium]|nr:MAG: hypothetical protein C4552_00530 [Candidatus Parcubacteria bacterium]
MEWGVVCAICGRRFLQGDQAVFEGSSFVHQACFGPVQRAFTVLRVLREIAGGAGICYACLALRLPSWEDGELQRAVFWLRGQGRISVHTEHCPVCAKRRSLVAARP